MTARRVFAWLVVCLLQTALFALLLTHGNDRAGWALLLAVVLVLAAVFSIAAAAKVQP